MDLKGFKKLLENLNKTKSKNESTSKKNTANLLIVFLVGVLILITINFLKNSSTNTNVQALNDNKKNGSKPQKELTADDRAFQNYETSVQEKFKSTLEKIEGVGKVEVMVNFESGEEQVPAVNVNDSTNTTEEKDNEGGKRSSTQKNNGSTVVITNDGGKSEPLIVKKYKPKVSGVCIVAEGAENKVTELRIAKAVVNLFNVSEDKVNVYPMKK